MQFATARIGAILVNVNPAYRAHELEYALKQAGRPPARAGSRASVDADYVAMLAEVGSAPSCASRSCSDDDWEALLAGGDGVPSGDARCARGDARR